MYIDPNTGGSLIQVFTFCGVCGIPLTLLIGIIGAVVYFIRNGKRNQPESYNEQTQNTDLPLHKQRFQPHRSLLQCSIVAIIIILSILAGLFVASFLL